jgi:hypothetical protein
MIHVTLVEQIELLLASRSPLPQGPEGAIALWPTIASAASEASFLLNPKMLRPGFEPA